jgi:hypothetical protein
MAELTQDGHSLYEVLSEPAPLGTLAGETSLTATKETLDGDTEDAGGGDEDIIHGYGG